MFLSYGEPLTLNGYPINMQSDVESNEQKFARRNLLPGLMIQRFSLAGWKGLWLKWIVPGLRVQFS
jgi:hypothetical protein